MFVRYVLNTFFLFSVFKIYSQEKLINHDASIRSKLNPVLTQQKNNQNFISKEQIVELIDGAEKEEKKNTNEIEKKNKIKHLAQHKLNKRKETLMANAAINTGNGGKGNKGKTGDDQKKKKKKKPEEKK